MLISPGPAPVDGRGDHTDGLARRCLDSPQVLGSRHGSSLGLRTDQGYCTGALPQAILA